MHFCLIDRVLEQTADRIVAIKQVTLAEEYLGDHFPGFPVLPGVMMLEAMAQAARRLLSDRAEEPLVLGEVRNLKYGAMVRPGQTLRLEVSGIRANDDGSWRCRGIGTVQDVAGVGADRSGDGETAVSGLLTMRPIRTHAEVVPGPA